MNYCIACRTKLPEHPLFVLEDAPASAQNIPDAEEVKEDRGVTLGLYQCGECGLVQFDCAPVSYYRDVIRAGGFTTTMTGLRRSQYRHLIETYHLEGKRFLEVGCGRGEFLKVLTEFPVQAYGMEHKAELVNIAQAEGLRVWQEFPETAEQIFGGAQAGGPFDVFLSFNFLEHQPEPNVMLQAIRNNLTAHGMGLVTVPALDYILEQGSYYELIRDHIAYYSFDTLGELLTRNGFAVLEEEMLNRDTIAMVVRKDPDWRPGGGDGIEARQMQEVPGGGGEVPEAEVPEAGVPEGGVPETGVPEAGVPKAGVPEAEGPEDGVSAEEMPEGGVPEAEMPEAGVSEAERPEGGMPAEERPEDERRAWKTAKIQASPIARILAGGYRRVSREVDRLLETLTAGGKSLAVWGASHQGFTLTATTGLGRQARYIIDSAPFKQGRFAPASHVPIVAPEHFAQEPVDVILIVAPGYTDEIAGSIRQRFTPCPQILTLRTDRIEQL